MVRVKMPDWQRDFNKRMADQLKQFAKAEDRPDRLTKWDYKNGKVVASSWGYSWVPNEKPLTAENV